MTRSQAELLVAVHEQRSDAITSKLPVDPSAPKDALVGEMSSVQGSRPFTRTDTGSPAIVSVPVRSASDVFSATLTVTLPFPVPLLPLVIVIQFLSEAAAHVQWLAAVTVTEWDPPAGPRDIELVDSE